MRHLEDSTLGVIGALLLVTILAIFSTVPEWASEKAGLSSFSLWPSPSPEFLRGIANLGGALVLAYVVQVAWMVREAEPSDDREALVGFMSGAGLAGLIGVVLMLALAEHRAAGYDNFLDRIGFWWAAIALVMLATVVTLHPLLAYRMSRERVDDQGD